MDPVLLYVSPLLGSSVLGIILIFFILRRPPTPSSRTLVALIAGALIWSLGYAFEFLSVDLRTMLFWARFQYFGILTVPLLWFTYANRYLGEPNWSEPPLVVKALLGVIPLLTLGLVWTNELHGLIWPQVQVARIGGIEMLAVDHGPGFWVYLVYGYLLMLLGTIKLLRGLASSLSGQNFQARLMLLGSIFPWLGNLVYISTWNPVPYLDWTPFAFIAAGLLFSLNLSRFHLIDIVPIANKTVFSRVPDCLLVLDTLDQIVDLNPEAQKMIGLPYRSVFGKRLAQVYPEFAGWLSEVGFEREFRVEFEKGKDADQTFHELRIVPLSGPYPKPVGRLLICHDITEHKQAQAVLEQSHSVLEALVAARTVELRHAVDQLQDELNHRSLAEKRFEELVESAPDALLLIDQQGTIVLVNPQVEQLFGYPREAIVGQRFDRMFPPGYHEQLYGFIAEFVTHAAQGQNTHRLNVQAMRQDGSRIPIEISLGTLATRDGFWLACNLRDISERVKTEQAQNQLMQELKQSHKQLHALTARLEEVQEIERRQIAGELHDCVGQNLSALHLNLQLIYNQLREGLDEKIQNRLSDSLKLVEETNRLVRNVMANLHPPVLDEFGLVAAIQWYGNIFSDRTGISVQVVGSEFIPRLPANSEIVLFRMVQEALVNASKHALASQVVISLVTDGDDPCLTIEDNGQGFDPLRLDRLSEQPHWGLVTMQQRAVAINGQLEIDSKPGQGTRLSVRFGRA